MTSNKLTDVVMLPSTQKASVLNLDNDNKLAHISQYEPKLKCGTHDLYFLSDDKINDTDWFIKGNEIYQCYKSHENDIEFKTDKNSVYCGKNTSWDKKFCKKVIATTNNTLRIKSSIRESNENSSDYGKLLQILPQPSKYFIKKYIEMYNNGTPIEKCEVEYGKYYKINLGDKLKVIRNVYGYKKGDFITFNGFNHNNDTNLISFKEDDDYQGGFHISHLDIPKYTRLKVNAANEITIHQIKDLDYWKNNAEENYIITPISVLRYISELEQYVGKSILVSEVIEKLEAMKNGANLSDFDHSKEKDTTEDGS